jgi:tRNA-dihydrouridine synthase 3
LEEDLEIILSLYNCGFLIDISITLFRRKSLTIPRYLLNPEARTVGSKPADDDAAESKTLLTSGVKASYGTPRRANAIAQPAGSDVTKENEPVISSNAIEQHELPNGESSARLEAENPKRNDRRNGRDDWKKNDRKKKKETGQNKGRQFGSWGDAIQLCPSRQLNPEFSPRECSHGEKCRFEHDLRKYLKDGKQADLTTFEVCPVWQECGFCPVGWKCRFVGSHSKEVDHEDGRKELVLVEDQERMAKMGIDETTKGMGTRLYNVIATKDKIDLERRRLNFKKSDMYSKWLTDSWNPQQVKQNNVKKGDGPASNNTKEDLGDETKAEDRAAYKEPPFRASEKRRLYYGDDTPVLAPLTTQGNLPFRRLCVELGAQVTWSEMAMGMPLIQGQKGEWALVKAHESETTPPKLKDTNVVQGYDNSVDMKFGVQMTANKPWLAFKATEVLAKYCPKLRAIDLNCGCPIELVFESGGGSALMNTAPKLEKMLRGMNACSGEIPVQVKIRTGVKDNAPTAGSLAERLILGGQTAQEEGLGPSGIAAMTLHGRSRQQRYTRLANWEYIAEVAAMIKDLRIKQNNIADTAREADPRDQPNGGQVYFIGNGDVYSHEDYYEHIKIAGVDSVMVARGALIKPWIFEEIEKKQHLDKSASERLEYVEKFCRYGLDTWGSDEMGVGTTRRFLLEWLSFTHRYIPLGVLEHLPPKINERPPPYKGRNEMETLLASDNYQDWIKIRSASRLSVSRHRLTIRSEMYLGPAHKDFKFTPKHKSNSYENIEAEG